MAKRKRLPPFVDEMASSLADLGFRLDDAVTAYYLHALNNIKDLPLRDRYREQFIKLGYEIVLELLEHARDPEKIKRASLRDIVLAVSVLMDKIIIVTGKFEQKDARDYAPIAAMSDEQLESFIVETQRTLSQIAPQLVGDKAVSTDEADTK